jgi:hypothetical protein
MDAESESTCPPVVGRRRRWATRLVWGIAIFCVLCAIAAIWHQLTFPTAIAKHPVRAEGTVTASIINGLGGDPAVEYRYTVAGRTYKGEGNGELGNQRPEFMRPGDPVAIEYAADAPSESCTCDAVAKQPGSTAATVIVAVLLCAPLCILLTRQRAQRRARRV